MPPDDASSGSEVSVDAIRPGLDPSLPAASGRIGPCLMLNSGMPEFRHFNGSPVMPDGRRARAGL